MIYRGRVLDRTVVFDDRSWAYRISRTMANKRPRSMLWPCNTWLDQGRSGGCMAFAAGLELAAGPVRVPGVTNDFATRRIYWPAQRIDSFPGGSYHGARPFMEGTDMLSVIKVVRDMGACDTFEWSFALLDTILGIGYNGPALFGTNCYAGMLKPDAQGFIHPTGKFLEGHGYIARGVNVEEKHFVVRMAWGRDWGNDGEAKLSFEDYKELFRQKGEASFLVDRHVIDVTNLPPEKKRKRAPWWAFWRWF